VALQRTADDLLAVLHAATPPPDATSAEPGRDAVTSGVTRQFLRRPPAATMMAEGRLLELGRRPTMTDVLIYSEGDADRWPRRP